MWDNVRRGEHTWIFPHQVPLCASLPFVLSLVHSLFVAAVAPLERRRRKQRGARNAAHATRFSPQKALSNGAGYSKDAAPRRSEGSTSEEVPLRVPCMLW